MFPRGYIAGSSLSKPVVLNLDNNGRVKSNSASNFIEIYRQSLRGNTRSSKYGYKSDLSNSMTRRPEHRGVCHINGVNSDEDQFIPRIGAATTIVPFEPIGVSFAQRSQREIEYRQCDRDTIARPPRNYSG